MSMKLVISLIAVSLFFLLSDITQTSKQQETPQAVQRQDFFKDFNPQTIMTGSWIDKIHKFDTFRKYPRNATRSSYDTFKTRSLGLLTRAWDFTVATTTTRARDCTVAMATRACNKCHSITMTMTAKIWNGVTLTTEWIWDKLTGLAGWIWDGVICLAEWIWDEFTWLAEWIWDGFTWMAWLIWDGVTWTGKPFTAEFNYITDVATKFYGEYLDRHVKHVQAHVFTMTWQDVFYMMSTVFVVNFILLAVYLLVSCAVNFILRRWQAYKDKRSAANLPPAPKKPIWRPKPKKKKRRNKNRW